MLDVLVDHLGEVQFEVKPGAIRSSATNSLRMEALTRV
jgi:hypothetical protein